ncbi:NXPE family member 4-like isoform X3 [Hyla sarda]|nr:NXPE family member 4-like isoform X3 [Hyla sarda]XP_056391793.1 NXPE family member 4-like isoform X3 [Hyla sarda]XP_056391794.1 NXPE family member 4-like isoform X3 [Hyla sarda]
MALVRNKCITPALFAAVFLLSYLWHKSVFQVRNMERLEWDSLKHLMGKCFGPVTEINVNFQPHELTTPQPRTYDLHSEINSIFSKIQRIIPNVTFKFLNGSTSANNSKLSIVNRRNRYCPGEDLVVQVDMYDHLGNRKTYGGDFITSRLFSPKLGAAVSGRVEDFHNGSYHVYFPLHWVDRNETKVSIRLWHPSEGIAVLWRARHASLGVLGFNGRYKYLGKEAITNCHFQLNTAEEVCEYKDEFYEEAFYCIKPKDIPCECLNEMRAVDLHESHLTEEEKPLFVGSNVGVEMAIGLETIVITDCGDYSSTSNTKCQTGMSSPVPSGHFYNYTWHPAYCDMTVYKTQEDFTKCLKGKKLFLIGDSTLRQYIIHFTEGIKIVNYLQYHEGGWKFWDKTLEALNMDKDIYVSYKRHGFPLENFLFYNFKDDMYMSRQIDLRGGGKDTIFVITMGQHFRQFPLTLYIRRAINIRRAVERLFMRSPDTKVIIKTENTREFYAPPERTGDFHGYTQYLVLREVFQGLNVGFVDAWDMTVASSTESVHPFGYTFDSIMSMTFSFAC